MFTRFFHCKVIFLFVFKSSWNHSNILPFTNFSIHRWFLPTTIITVVFPIIINILYMFQCVFSTPPSSPILGRHCLDVLNIELNWEIAQVKGSVLQDWPHFLTPNASSEFYLCFWQTGYRMEIPMIPSSVICYSSSQNSEKYLLIFTSLL